MFGALFRQVIRRGQRKAASGFSHALTRAEGRFETRQAFYTTETRLNRLADALGFTLDDRDASKGHYSTVFRFRKGGFVLAGGLIGSRPFVDLEIEDDGAKFTFGVNHIAEFFGQTEASGTFDDPACDFLIQKLPCLLDSLSGPNRAETLARLQTKREE